MRFKKYTFFPGIIILILSSICAQVTGQERFPDLGILYDDATLARVDITIHPDSLALILMDGNEQSDHEYMASFKFIRGEYSHTIDSVGFRLRGNTSRNSQKKSFKVSLNTFIPGQKFMGVEKLNLNGEHNDPSISRARICWKLFRDAEVPAPRSNHVELYINGEYRGLYINVEHIDEEFVDLRFGNNNGNLYKCLWPADLDYLGASPDLYKFKNGERQAYELKTNQEENDYSDLAAFINILNNTPINDLTDDLNMIFNINTYLKNLVVEVLAGHWDSYAYLKNNYYLYHNLRTGKFEYIPYDTDNTLGISWFDDDWTERNIYDWANQSEARPMVERVLANSVYRDRFSFYMKRFLDEFYNSETLDPYIEAIRDQVESSAASDVYRSMDYGFTYNDFYESFDLAYGAHVRRGLKPFVEERSASALSQLDVNPIDPIITLLYVNRPDFAESAKVEFLVEDDNAISEVKVWIAETDEYIPLNPENKGNGLFSFSYPGIGSTGELKYYLTATDSQSNTTRDPLQGYYSIFYTATSDHPGEIQVPSKLKLYPNPADSYVRLRLPESYERFYYSIYDASGRMVSDGGSNSNDYTIELGQELDGGLYIIEIQSYSSSGVVRKEYSKFILRR